MRPVKSIVLAVSIGTIALSGCDSSDDTATLFSDLTLTWQRCNTESIVQCATLEVPAVHTEPEGDSITLALRRLPSSSDTPQGSLVFNPGGPGGSGTELIEIMNSEDIVPQELSDAFHIVSFDPRGVNLSTPVDCREFIDGNYTDNYDDYPRNRQALAANAALDQQFVSACSNKYGEYLKQLGSSAVVDDMELIRKSLGDEKLNFVGISYGTRLAALYAERYPQQTGRVVLDASLPSTHDNISLFRGQLQAHQKNLVALVDRCTGFSACNPADVLAQLENRLTTLIDNEMELELDLVAQIVIASVQTPELAAITAAPLYSYLQNGDTTALLAIMVSFEDVFEEEETDYDSITPARGVICSDDAARPTVDELEALRTSFNNTSDIFAELFISQSAMCSGWPQSLAPLEPISTNQAPATLVIGGPTDTQTPAIWSQQMASAIGGHYLLSDHPGHTALFSDANDCTEEAVIDFLLLGELPDTNQCGAQAKDAE